MSTTFESENGTVAKDPDAEAVDKLVRDLDGAGNSYASLTLADGSYIQVGGGPDEFTVELRQVRPARPFRHFKAEVKGSTKKPRKRKLPIGGSQVSVESNQVLDRSTVVRLFRFFLQEHGTDPSVEWKDMTDMFGDQ